MKTVMILCCVMALSPARIVVVIEAADPNCVPVAYSPSLLPEAIDPNCIVGSLLAPIPGDPNTWTLPSGRWNRPLAKACDPEGDPFTIEYAGGTLPTVSIGRDRANGMWRCSADLVPNTEAVPFHVLYFETTDAPLDDEPASRTYTICFVVPSPPPPNTAPVLY